MCARSICFVLWLDREYRHDMPVHTSRLHRLKDRRRGAKTLVDSASARSRPPVTAANSVSARNLLPNAVGLGMRTYIGSAKPAELIEDRECESKEHVLGVSSAKATLNVATTH